jgi:hypothetical protein
MLYGKQCGWQSERGLTKCSFNSSIREGKLNAKEYCGIVLVMACIFQSALGKNQFCAAGFGQTWIQNWLEL